MKKKMQRTTVSYFLAADTKANSQGEVKIYLRFYENGKKTDYFTGIRWKLNLFDKQNQCLLKRHAHDPDCLAYNLILAETKKIAHQVQVDAYTHNKEITVSMYLSALGASSPTTDFVAFAFDEINRQYNTHVIQYKTWRQHRSAMNRLVEFWKSKTIPLELINVEKIRDFDAHWRAAKKASNTITGYHKVIKKLLNVAIEKNLIPENPYAKFKFRYVDGDREALTQEEVKHLLKMYQNNEFHGMENQVVRRFLFSCLTGIRISDTHRVHSTMIRDQTLKFKPKKGLRYGKIVTIPLPSAAIKLIEGQKGLLFEPCSDKHINFLLKIIAVKAGIEKRLTYHCARDTFGTIFIELGGDIKSCCDLMGHSSTRTTAIYLKMSDQRKRNLMNNFDTMFAS